MTQISKINGIPISNTSVSGFTYDGVNTLTISETDGTSHNAIITNIGGGSITGGTNLGSASNVFYGVNGSNLEFNTISGTSNYKITTAVVGNQVQIDIDEPNMTLWPLVVQGNTLISGGATYLSGLTFNISDLSYIIGSTIYASSATTVTLTSGDTSFDRIDVIYADSSTLVGVVEGTPSANPSKPTLDSGTQVEVTFVTVPANSAAPTVTVTKIYDEALGSGGGEWDFTTTTPSTILSASTATSFSGSKSIEFVLAPSGDNFDMDTTPSYDISSDNTLTFYIKNKVAWDNNGKKYIDITLKLSGTTNGIPAKLDDGLYGFDDSNITSWQTIAIPLGAFNMSSNLVDNVNFEVKETGGSTDLELYIDLIRFQSGAATTSPQNLWLSFISDDNVITTADSNTSQLRLSGGTNMTTRIVGKTVVFDGVGSFTSFNVSGDTGQETIEDSNTLLLYGGEGIKSIVTATDTVTHRLDITGTTVEASPASGAKLVIYQGGEHRNIDWDDLPGAGGGETNTLSSVGGGNDLYYDKVSSDLQLRTLVAGTNVTITSGATTLTINSTGGSSRTTSSVQTSNADVTTGDTINTLTDNATNIVEVYVKAYETAAAEYGVWKRTLSVTSVSGTVVIREKNADVDKTSTGLNANSLDFEVSGGNINILVTGILSTTIDWETAWEIIL